MANVSKFETKKSLISDEEIAGKTIMGLVFPAEELANEATCMRGHHTYINNNSKIVSSVIGFSERVNKLVCVNPLKSKYIGDVGDVIVGRVTRIENKRWHLEVNARREAILLLSSINLPGGELRRKNVEDELQMRHYMKKGDLVVAEVQHVNSDGTLSLHTRSLKYGKLPLGCQMKVQSSRIKRHKTQIHSLPFGIMIIFGANGYIWIGPKRVEQMDLSQIGGHHQYCQTLTVEENVSIAILKICIEILDTYDLSIYVASVMKAYDIAKNYTLQDLQLSDTKFTIAEEVKIGLLENISI